MERYFLGNNTAFGFVGYYESELKDKDRVFLLKGGPGTGKSSMLKKLAQIAKQKGYDVELWFCSGDPQSLDGVYIKQLNIAIVDATAPHATGADLPIIKDKIYDLASSLNRSILTRHKDDINKLINDKKYNFMRAYQHLKCANCHFNSHLDIEKMWVNEKDIRAYSAVFCSELRAKCKGVMETRKLFTQAICPNGESVYYDHLRDKHIYKVSGCAYAKRLFFDELNNICTPDAVILNPLNPNIIDGAICKDVAIVQDIGHFDSKMCEHINLGIYEKRQYVDDAEEEKNNMLVSMAFAVERLNMARASHIELEKYFVDAMDFDNNNEICAKIAKDIFG